MLRPQSNDYRDFIRLDGMWGFRSDPDDNGEALGFTAGFVPEAMVAVPGSINEQLAERGFRDYHGAAWLMWRGRIPRRFTGQALRVYFASADLKSSVWANSVLLGHDDQPFLPFDYPLDLNHQAWLTLVVRVDGRLDHQHPLPGIVTSDYERESRIRDEIYPPVRYDFFPYLGLHRGVSLCAEPIYGLREISVRTDFDATRQRGSARITMNATQAHPSWRATIHDADEKVCASVTAIDDMSLELSVDNASPWQPDQPTLYTLRVTLLQDDAVVDQYEMMIGFRRIQVQDDALLLNDQPLRLRGFGMHEDFPVIGKGECAALRVKDYELLRWVGANSFRTSHYAYSEETLDEADRRGVVVISEVASVNLDFRHVTADTLRRHCELISRQIKRDGAHASVIAWSLTNEPGYLAEPEYLAKCDPYFNALFAHARGEDSSRPLTAANVGRNGLEDPMFRYCDFISLNRYRGWYDMPGQLARAEAALIAEFAAIHKRWQKPMLLTEFGADAIPGMHSSSDQLFTEEYQADFIAMYWRVIDATPACVGGQVWNFADFRTAQHHRRVQFNHKGVFTRTREPKMAAWRLRKLWGVVSSDT